jgi:GPI mannosyltransferase 3
MKKMLPRYVITFMILGLLLRLLFHSLSHHLYYPDELFQSLEPGYRLLHGYGIVPWDVAYGLRTPFFWTFTTAPIWVLHALGLNDPAIYIPGVKLWLSLFSISLIPAAYILTSHVSKSKIDRVIVTFSVAVWYELIYFSGRAFSEVTAVNFFALALIAAFTIKRASFIAPALITLGVLLRPQYALIGVLGYLFLYQHRYSKPRHLVQGTLVGLLPIALTDTLLLGYPFASIINNLRLSFLSGASEIFGTKSQWWYVQALLGAGAGVPVFLVSAIKRPPLKPLVWLIVAIILIHSLLAHKEYRFLYVLIPLILLVAATELHRVLSNHLPRHALAGTLTVIASISLLGMFHQLPGQSTAYAQPPLLKDPYYHLLSIINKDPAACGVLHHSRGWVYAGGYYSVGKNIPQYDAPLTLETHRYNYLITHGEIPNGYSVVTQTSPYTVKVDGKPLTIPPYLLAKRPGDCEPNYSDYRTFDAIEDRMHEMGAAHVYRW